MGDLDPFEPHMAEDPEARQETRHHVDGPTWAIGKGKPLGLLGTIGGQPFRRTTNDRPSIRLATLARCQPLKRLHIIFIPTKSEA